MKHTLAGACAALFIFSGHTALLALFNRPVSVLDQARQITASVVAFKVRLMQHLTSTTNHWPPQSFAIPIMSPK